MASAAMSHYKELIRKKEDIENTIQELTLVLESQKNVGMTEALVDDEGFPRADIDVYSCRHARHHISCLQNDHKALMEEIESALEEIHAQARQEKERAAAQNGQGTEAMDVSNDIRSSAGGDVIKSSAKSALRPFAVVDRVDQGSPASQGGIEVEDLLVQFGSITLDNFSLKQVAAVLKHSIDKSVNVTLLRGDKEVKLSLTPTKWSGPGYLGCNINPLSSSTSMKQT